MQQNGLMWKKLIKSMFFTLYHWEILTKVHYRLFIKTLKIYINLYKMVTDDPFKH